MANTPHMRVVWAMRRAILDGQSVSDIARTTGCSESTVRNYTKAERAKVKEQQKEAKNRAEHYALLREAASMH